MVMWIYFKNNLAKVGKKSGSDIWIYVSQQNKYRKIEQGKIASYVVIRCRFCPDRTFWWF